ncbi:MAG: hypothetical protein VXW18_09085, partial [Pseudomonadota bacterium]|nr:hypothetical protein [Pseudomonadota bacterium]
MLRSYRTCRLRWWTCLIARAHTALLCATQSGDRLVPRLYRWASSKLAATCLAGPAVKAIL